MRVYGNFYAIKLISISNIIKGTYSFFVFSEQFIATEWLSLSNIKVGRSISDFRKYGALHGCFINFKFFRFYTITENSTRGKNQHESINYKCWKVFSFLEIDVGPNKEI